MFQNPSVEACCALLTRVKNIAVVGLSPNPSRPSFGVSAAMKGYGFNVIPVHPVAQEILGEKVYARLADVPPPIDLVNVFRNAEFVDGVVDECIAIKAPAIWIQEGIVNEPAAERARAAGITVIMDRCIYRDYRANCI
jgi:uncharacterized protein